MDPCLDRLEQRGLLNDAAVASAFVRDRIRYRPRGKGRLTQELRAKGVAERVAHEAVDRVLEDEDLSEAQLAARVLEAWLRRQGPPVLDALASEARTPERERAYRRLHGYLARRGFTGAALSRAKEMARTLLEDRA